MPLEILCEILKPFSCEAFGCSANKVRRVPRHQLKATHKLCVNFAAEFQRNSEERIVKAGAAGGNEVLGGRPDMQGKRRRWGACTKQPLKQVNVQERTCAL